MSESKYYKWIEYPNVTEHYYKVSEKGEVLHVNPNALLINVVTPKAIHQLCEPVPENIFTYALKSTHDQIKQLF